MTRSNHEKPFRERLLDEIRDSNLKLAKIARESGVSYNVLIKLKRGDNQTTSAENAEKLARYFEWDDTPTGTDGFSEPGQAALSAPMQADPEVTPVPDPVRAKINQFELTTTAHTVRITGTFDRDGIDMIIDKLRTIQKILDKP